MSRDGWDRCRIGDIFTVARGGSPRPIDAYLTDDPEGINWIKIGDATASGKFIRTTKERIKPEGLSKTRKVIPGDFILSNSMSFGRPYIMAIDGCIHDGWLLLRPNDENSIDREFYYYLLGSDILQQLFSTQAAGSAVRNLNIDLVAAVEVQVPPLHEQRRIAEILSSVDDAIAATRAVIEQTRKVRSEILSTSFPEGQAAGPSSADNTFEGWSVEPASSICESIIDCKNRTPPVTEDGYAVVRTPNVRNGRFRYEGLQFTNKQSFQEWTAKGMPRAGDILFTREAPYGEVCMAPAMAFCLGQRMMFLRPDTTRVSSDFLLYALQSGPVKKEMFRRAGGSTVGHLRVGDVRELPIPVAPRAVQLRLTATLRSLDEALNSNEATLSRLEDCKSALMSDLLTGRKRVTDALPMAAE